MRLTALAFLLMPALAGAEEIAQVGVDWVGNDIVIEAVADPVVGGVTCHLAYFERSVLDRLSQGNWFEDPSNSAIQCAMTGSVDVSTLRPGRPEDVFSEGRSLLFKSLRVKRIYDAKNRVLIYLAHASELSEGSAKMSMSTVPLPPDTTSGPGAN
ncbi:CreA family protein [Paracoccus sp. WLY502]|uniref:CreA family protein n=1 Tax=Paracoccus yibinensis TaxID=3068891 RepID=UPI00279673E0|nr:CreA family protein [Paracoccus sp. WLY502]MDQ1901462.1 CreA family protein [Paracoccus sp. WLY502]